MLDEMVSLEDILYLKSSGIINRVSLIQI